MESEFVAFVAIDWADQKHAWVLQLPGHQIGGTERSTIHPRQLLFGRPNCGCVLAASRSAVALEQSRGPLVFMLTKYDHLVFPVHPTVLVNYRKSFRPSEQRTIRAMLGSRWIS